MIGVLNGSQICGNDYDVFCTENAEIAESTKTLLVYGRDITILSVCDVPEYQESDRTIFWVLSDECLRDFRKFSKPLKRAYIKNERLPHSVMQEMKDTTGMMLLINNEKYIVSQHAMATLSMQASVSGTMTLNRSNILRDMHLADALFCKNDAITLVYREITDEDGRVIRKIYAAFAGAYREIPQTVVRTIADSIMEDDVMGKASVGNWSINHELTKLELHYPETAEEYSATYGIKEVVPGVLIQTSDTGDSAITVFGTQKVRSSFVITEEISVKHTKKNQDVSSFIKEIDEKIFFEHRKLPEILAKLIGEEAVDYSKKEAFQNLCLLVEDVTTELLKGVLTKRQILSLLDAVKAELSDTIPYTMYDIAIMLMELPERLHGISEALMIDVRKALSKAPEVVNKKLMIYLTA